MRIRFCIAEIDRGIVSMYSVVCRRIGTVGGEDDDVEIVEVPQRPSGKSVRGFKDETASL